MPDYEYDVFISYERDSLTTGWITEHFLPLFRTWLRAEIIQACERQALPIFFDTSQTDPEFPQDLKLKVAGIEPGSDWDDSLRDAIRASRCMVGIWNPPYFYSHWCNIEWQSFDNRAQATGSRVLIPTSFYDGKSFPARAAAIKPIDFTPYALFGRALKDSKGYGNFQKAVQLLAQKVALAVKNAPPYQDWPIADGIPAPPSPPPLPLPRL